jgi:dihydroxy-acid dehydratase
MTSFARDGGVPALLHALGKRIDTSAPTVTGRPWADELRPAAAGGVIRPLDKPVQPTPGLVVLKGSLAPAGAILRLSTASPSLSNHTGPAVVFENYNDMLERIDSPDLPVTPESILILKNSGAMGVPGLPEWGNIPIPSKLLRAGVEDMVRISDSRMSGTAHGTVILHVAPEAAAGGPLALVRDGDLVCLDVANRRLDLVVPEEELALRRAAWTSPASPHLRGWPRLYRVHVLGPEDGCDFDFLQPDSDEALPFVPPVVGRS